MRIITLVIILATGFASAAGVFIPSVYSAETDFYAAQGIGQDIVNLCIVLPVLLYCLMTGLRTSGTVLVWASGISYLLYSYIIYSFGVHFNSLFLIYCAIFGLCFYTLVFFFASHRAKIVKNELADVLAILPIRSTIVFYYILASLFAMMWLAEVVPAILDGAAPESAAEVGLPVNPVHVLDFAVLLPSFVITALLLRGSYAFGLILAPILLGYCIFMGIAICGMVFVLHLQGFEVHLELVLFFAGIILTATYFLIQFIKPLSIAGAQPVEPH